MAIADAVGHNKNGKVVYKIKPDGTYLYDKGGQKIIDDDLPVIAENFKSSKKESHLGFNIDTSSLNDYILYQNIIIQKLKKNKKI